MPDPKKIEANHTENPQSTGQRGPTASQVAAAVEAAYILEAVRK